MLVLSGNKYIIVITLHYITSHNFVYFILS